MLAAAATVTAQVRGLRLYNPLVSDSSTPNLSNISGRTVVQTIRTILLPFTAVVGTAGNSPLVFPYNAEDMANGKGYFDFYEVTLDSDTDANPSDFFRGQGFHLTMEVRD